MPPLPRHGGRVRRFLPLLAAALLILAGAAFLRAGAYLYAEDPLTKADAIVILGGTFAERPLEAAELYRAGYAPVVLVSHAVMEPAILVARRRGITLPAEPELSRMVLEQSGVPPDAIEILGELHDNTSQEGKSLRDVAAARGWRAVIVVSSKYHLRRAGFALRRELAGRNVRVIMRGSRYDPSQPERWWTSRRDWRWMLSEVPKFTAYVLGLGG